MDGAILAVWPCELEVRAGGRKLAGSFPYGATAVVKDRGRVRKERFRSGAFSWQIREFDRLQAQLATEISRDIADAQIHVIREELARRNVDLPRGHSFDKPLGSLLSGSLRFDDTATALKFEANLPADPPTWISDTIRAVEAGLIRGVSPGFRVPPASVVANAEELIDEAATRVQDRQINQAVLSELSLVTRLAYSVSGVSVRGDGDDLRNLFAGLPGRREADDWEAARWL